MKKIEKIKDKVIIAIVYLITIILAVLLLASCEKKENSKEYYVSGYHVVIVDSCEYIQKRWGYGGVMAHKGNCRYCIERNKKLIREQVDSVLTDIYD